MKQSDTQPIQLSGSFTVDDWRIAQRLCFALTQRPPLWAKVLLIGSAILVWFAGYTVLTALIFTLLFLAAAFIDKIIVITFSARTFKEHHHYHVPFKIIVDDEGVATDTKLQSGKAKWDTFKNYKYNDEMLILLITPRMMYMIPRRFAETAEDWGQLLALVEEKVAKPKKK